MSEGTSLDDIESGNIKHAADDQIMNDILKDMNTIDGGDGGFGGFAGGGGSTMPSYQPDLPQVQQPPQLPQVQQVPQYLQQPPMMPMMPNMPSMPMMMPNMMQPSSNNNYYEEEEAHDVETSHMSPSHPRKNTWSTLFDTLRDPLIVAIIVALVSLPALHTRLGKYLKWAYVVGGSLSWAGLALQSILAGALFYLFRECLSDI